MNETTLNLRDTLDTLTQTGQFDTLFDVCKTALVDARERNDKSSEALSLVGLAQVHKFSGKFHEARVFINGAIELADALQDQALYALALLVSGSIHLTATYQAFEAEQDFRSALRVAHDIQDADCVADALAGLSAVYQHLNDPVRAQRYASEAFHIAREQENRYLMALALSVMGSAAGAIDPEKAIKAYEDAMAIVETHSFRVLEAGLRGSIGQLLMQQGRYRDEGLQLLESSLSHAKDIGSVPHEFTALYRLGRVLEGDGQLEDAANYYTQMLERAQEWRARPYEGIAFFNLGVLAFNREHMDDAAANFEQALLIARETKNPYQEAQAEQSLGATYSALNDYDAALGHYMAARALYEALDHDSMTRKMLQAVLMTYVNRIVDRLLRWLGLRDDNQNHPEA